MAELNNTENVLQQLMKRLERTPRGRLETCRRRWREAVGPILSKKSIVGAVDDGKWIVYTENSAWMQELFMQKKRLMKKINQAAGFVVVTEIELKPGRIPASSVTTVDKEEPKEEEVLPPLTPAQEEEIERQCANIPIPELRASMVLLRRRQAQLDTARREAGWQTCLHCRTLTDCRDRICDRCRIELQQKREQELLQFLVRRPAAQYEEVRQTLSVSEKEYEEARHYLIQRTVDRVWRRQETEEEQWMLARLLTRLDGNELTAQHKDNLIRKLVRQSLSDETKNR